MRNIIAILSLVAFIAMGCEKPSQTGISSETQSDLEKIPAHVNAVFYSNLAKLSQSELGKEFFDRVKEKMEREVDEQKFAEFNRAMKFEDLQQILVAVNVDKENQSPPYAILRGTFDEQRIKTFVEEMQKDKWAQFELQAEQINGATLYSTENGEDFAAAFVDNKVLYLGPKEWVKAVLQNEKISPAVSENASLQSLIKSVAYGEQLWLVADQPLKNSGARFPVPSSPQAKKIMDAVQAVAFSVRAGEELKIKGQIVSDSAEDSQLLVDLLKGGIAAIKLSAAGDRTAVDALNKIKVYQEDEKTVISGEITKELIESLKSRHLAMYK